MNDDTQANETIFAPPPASSGSSGRSVGLPADLMNRARRRIGVLGILGTVGFLFGWLVGLIAGDPELETALVSRAFVLSGALCTAVLWIGARRSRLSVDALINVALVVEVLLCLLISLYATWHVNVSSNGLILPYITWVSPIIILFPLLIPTPPRRALTAAIVAASMRPAASFALSTFGVISTTPGQIITSSVSPVIAVLFAFVSARVVYGLGVEVEKARRLGSYQLERKLGAGGMGEVWRAKHRLLARPAAIKLIRHEAEVRESHGQSSSALARFEQEAQTTALLRSPHTVELYDFGVADDGRFYYVMELLDGFDLSDLVDKFGPVPPERTIHFLTQATHSLTEAHKNGLVHRDIKPANLVACRYGHEVDFLKVLDFGLVKTPQRPGAGDPQLTVGEIAGGTPGFMAPEQFLGNRPPDGRTDLYALGCVGYWLLTGKLVFEAGTPMEIMVHHANTPPTPPSKLAEQRIPEDLEAVIMACLEKDPDKRPANAEALEAALRACSSAGAWATDRAHRWWETNSPEPMER